MEARSRRAGATSHGHDHDHDHDHSHDHDHGTHDHKARSLAQLFTLITGLVLVAVGIIGFFVTNGSDFGLPESLQPGAKGELFGLFDINGWENVIHIATGALLLIGSTKPNLARTVLLVFGLAYVAVTLLGFIDSEDVLGLFPVNTEGNLLHAALAGSSLLAALAPVRRTDPHTGERKTKAV